MSVNKLGSLPYRDFEQRVESGRGKAGLGQWRRSDQLPCVLIPRVADQIALDGEAGGKHGVIIGKSNLDCAFERVDLRRR
jgi:hypothetical protein